MLMISSIDELPAELPSPVALAIELSARAEAAAHEREPWGTLTGAVLRFFVPDDGPELGYQATRLASSPGTYKAGALIRALSRSTSRTPVAAPGRHLGTGFLAEGLDVDDALADELRDDPARLAEQFHDLVAAGKARQFRVLLGVLAGGWRFELRRDRHGATPTITIARLPESLPETLDADFVAAVTDLDAHLATHAR